MNLGLPLGKKVRILSVIIIEKRCHWSRLPRLMTLLHYLSGWRDLRKPRLQVGGSILLGQGV
jgi:hypothetical protein